MVQNQNGYDLWQNTAYDWVEDESARYGLGLKEAIISSTEINPALRHLLTFTNSPVLETPDQTKMPTSMWKRNAMYELGGHNSLLSIQTHKQALQNG